MEYKVYLLPDAVNFLDSINLRFRAKSLRTIELLKQFGPMLSMPHSRKIVGSENLFELRVQLATDICRIFYFHYNNEIFILTSGFVKKTQKTNPSEIAKANKLKLEFLKRKGEKNE